MVSVAVGVMSRVLGACRDILSWPWRALLYGDQLGALPLDQLLDALLNERRRRLKAGGEMSGNLPTDCGRESAVREQNGKHPNFRCIHGWGGGGAGKGCAQM